MKRSAFSYETGRGSDGRNHIRLRINRGSGYGDYLFFEDIHLPAFLECVEKLSKDPDCPIHGTGKEGQK